MCFVHALVQACVLSTPASCPRLCFVQGKITHGIEGVLPHTDAAHDFAQGFGDFMSGLSRIPHRLHQLSQAVTPASIQERTIEQRRRSNALR